MPGKIKRTIDTIIAQRARGNAVIASTTRTKLVLKGINPSLYTATSPDDPVVLGKLSSLARDLGICL